MVAALARAAAGHCGYCRYRCQSMMLPSGKGAYHLINLCRVELLNISEDPDVVAAHKVDGHTLASVSA